MTWRWLALVDDAVPADAGGSVAVRDGRSLVWWEKSVARPPGGLRVDERIVAGGGRATWVSWCRLEGEASFAFDDGAVTGALRRRHTAAWPEACSTMLVDWSRIAGAVTTGTSIVEVAGDPFAIVFPRTLLRVAAGSLGPIPAPTGPGVTRYGSGNPWPWDRYAGQVT
ncbi:MAG TPA: hypothetical protein VM143_03530 [Acidimicrobiales bacterium]|nr:hypothetical protein [Acidimicrobiales bacterium]